MYQPFLHNYLKISNIVKVFILCFSQKIFKCYFLSFYMKTVESPLHCKEILPVHSKGDKPWDFFGMMLKLKLQYFGHLMRRVNSLEKTLML